MKNVASETLSGRAMCNVDSQRDAVGYMCTGGRQDAVRHVNVCGLNWFSAQQLPEQPRVRTSGKQDWSGNCCVALYRLSGREQMAAAVWAVLDGGGSAQVRLVFPSTTRVTGNGGTKKDKRRDAHTHATTSTSAALVQNYVVCSSV